MENDKSDSDYFSSDKWWKGWSWKPQKTKEQRAEEKAKMLEAKNKRFTLTARLLGEKKTTVQIIDDKSCMPAIYDTSNDLLYLNEAHPRTTDKVKALIYDRGKLFHELGHCRWTQKECNRETLANQLEAENGENARGQFMAMSNVLEDGRIERLLRLKWEGAGKYLDTLLSDCVGDGGPNPVADSPFGSLPLYVRKGVFKNETDAKFWEPYLKDIETARTSVTTRNVCKIAADLIRKVGHLLPPIPPPQNPPPPSTGSGSGESKDKDENKSSSKSSMESADGNGTGAGGEKNEAEAIAAEALERCRPEAQELLSELEEEITQDNSNVQQYATGEEEAQAEQLAEIFRSILTEMNRQKFSQSREGKLNPHTLTKALTNRRCFATREPTLGTPFVTLLLDVSGSMSSELDNATSSARIVNGALQKSGIESRFFTFGSDTNAFNVVPVATPSTQGSTATGAAMELANTWLESKEAERSLMIVITDGGPNDMGRCGVEKDRLREHGGHVLGIVYEQGIPLDALKLMMHSHVNFLTSGSETLPSLLEPKLAQFLIGESE